MKVVLTDRAKANLRAIQVYIAHENVAAAARVASEIRRTIELLETYPLIGQEYQGEVRRITVGRYRYNIFYTVDPSAEQVNVLTVRHGYRIPPDFN